MTMSFELLLPEVLTRIFSFLHIEDRKKVRLVCKEWNNCCNHPAILKREKFVFRSGYPLEDIVPFLQNCEKIRKTVEFQGVVFDELSDDLWQIIGRNVHSLMLHKCTGTSEMTKNIFLHCSNMHSFKSSNSYRTNCRLDDTPYSLALWDKLIELNIERHKVISFQLFVGGVELAKDVVLQKIFKIFPCISHFGTDYPQYARSIDPDRVYGGSFHNTFNPALIKELIFNIPCSRAWLREFSNCPSLKLQKLDIIMNDHSTVSLDIFSKLLQNQCELETLKIRLLTEKMATKPLLLKILSICTKLTDFYFSCRGVLDIKDFYCVLQAVSELQLLERFRIRLMVSYEIEDPMTFQENLSTYLIPIANKSLHSLECYIMRRCLPSSQELLRVSSSLGILQHFCNLYHLKITTVSDEILQTIFKYHIHLRTLIIVGGYSYSCTAFGFTGKESNSSAAQETSYSISRLQELERLELQFIDESVLEKTIQHFNFPRLKYCRLIFSCTEKEVPVPIINLQFLPAMIPLVEVLIIDDILLSSADQYLLFCENLQRLKLFFFRYSYYEERLGINEETIKSMFIARPSLKYAADMGYKNTYFYDRFSKALSFVNFHDLVF